jgi:hypothetical protein
VVFLGGGTIYTHMTCEHLPFPFVCASIVMPFASAAYHGLQDPDPNQKNVALVDHASLVGNPVWLWWLDTTTLTFMFLTCGWSMWIPWPVLLVLSAVLPFKKKYHLSTIGVSVISAGIQAIQLATYGSGFSLWQLAGFPLAVCGVPVFLRKPDHLWPNRARYVWHMCAAIAIVVGAQFLSAQTATRHLP